MHAAGGEGRRGEGMLEEGGTGIKRCSFYLEEGEPN
jgi:hypothetical protein